MATPPAPWLGGGNPFDKTKKKKPFGAKPDFPSKPDIATLKAPAKSGGVTGRSTPIDFSRLFSPQPGQIPANAVRRTQQPAGQYSSDMDRYRTNGATAGTHPLSEQSQDPTGFVFGGQVPSLDMFMSQAQSQSAAPGYANQISDLDKRKQEAMQQILYGSQDLSKTLGQSRTDLDARYAKGIAEQAAAVQAAQAAIQQGQATTNSGNADLAKNLGIVIDQSNVAKDAANAQGSLASQATAADSRLRGDQLSQYTLGTRNMDAGLARGREDQNRSRNNFDSAIAQLLDQQQQATAQASDQGYSRFQDAQQEYDKQQQFAYQQWLQQHGEDRQDAQSQLDWEHQLQLQSGKTADPSAYDQLLAGIQFQNPQSQVAKLSQYSPKAQPGQPGSFQTLFGGVSNSNQAAFRQYLKQMGLLS